MMRPRLLAISFVAFALPGLCAAQGLPSVSSSGGQYVLTIPYLEYGSGSAKLAYGAVMRSSDLSTFVLDAASVTVQSPFVAAIDSPTVAALNTGYRLSVPRLSYTAGGTTLYYTASFISTDLSRFLVDPATVADVGPQAALNGPTAVVVANVSEQTVGSARVYSSSRLSVTWRAPTGYAVDHYEITASESVFGTSVTGRANGADTAISLTGLKAATPVSITVKACGDSGCTQSGVSSPASGTTSGEYWQLQGSGNSVSGLTRIVSDGNARISATRFGPEAGANASRIQLYYGAASRRGLATAVTSTATDAAVASSYLSFTSLAGTTGLIPPPTSTSLVTDVATGQGVPLSSGVVRLFFEAPGGDGKVRIMYLDSQDGFTGRDFNAGSSGVCSTAADYQSGGGCVPTVAIGVEGDATNANSRIQNARQFKLGFPILDDWRWNGEAGTFMVFTTGGVSGCSSYNQNHGFASWIGSRWQVQYASGGCPKLFQSVQAGFPMHVGGARYKMYFGDPSITTGRVPTVGSGPGLPFLGPKKLIYADGGSTQTASVEFEDWETTAAGRNVVFLWPNGDPLNDTAEGYIDDFHFLAPTGTLDLQVMYMAITDGSIAPIGAAAVLLNP